MLVSVLSHSDSLLAFLLAIVLIDAFEISLPRGDSIGVSGALVGAAVVLFGVGAALALGTASVLLSQVSRRVLGVGTSLVDELVVRIAATFSAGAIAWIVGQFIPAVGGIVTVPAAYLLAELVCRQALLAARAKRSAQAPPGREPCAAGAALRRTALGVRIDGADVRLDGHMEPHPRGGTASPDAPGVRHAAGDTRDLLEYCERAD